MTPSATDYLHNAVNEYTSVGGTAYEYDAAGNLTKDDTHYYYWDYENRLTKVKLVDGGTDVAEYTCDASMRRVEKGNCRGHGGGGVREWQTIVDGKEHTGTFQDPTEHCCKCSEKREYDKVDLSTMGTYLKRSQE